ncbi:MAG: ketopantoate reductase family protein [Eubacteriales bacterium]
MEINKVSIIGLGALGILYGNHLLNNMPKENLRILADENRVNRYKEKGVFCNGNKCNFNYITPNLENDPADLMIFSVKYGGLKEAIKTAENQIGDNTIIISTLNGIVSEKEIGKSYGVDKVVYCVAQGMDALKKDNELTYHSMGDLCIGELNGEEPSEKLKSVVSFFEKVNLPYILDNNMKKRLWGKFMLNVGVNQTVALYKGTYDTIQTPGKERNTMIAAMREVMELSKYEGLEITEEDLDYWLNILDTLNPQGLPSMRQDTKAKRSSEVDLFAGTVVNLGKKHSILTPVNQMLYNKIKKIEKEF